MATKKSSLQSQSLAVSSSVSETNLEKRLDELECRFNDLLSKLQETPGVKSRVGDI